MKCTRICLRMSRDTQADYKSMKPYIDIATRTSPITLLKIANILRRVGK